MIKKLRKKTTLLISAVMITLLIMVILIIQVNKFTIIYPNEDGFLYDHCDGRIEIINDTVYINVRYSIEEGLSIGYFNFIILEDYNRVEFKIWIKCASYNNFTCSILHNNVNIGEFNGYNYYIKEVDYENVSVSFEILNPSYNNTILIIPKITNLTCGESSVSFYSSESNIYKPQLICHKF